MFENNHLKSFNDAAESLANQMLGFCKQTRRERIIQRNRTERLSEFLDWKNLGRYYQQARQMALDALLPEVCLILRRPLLILCSEFERAT